MVLMSQVNDVLLYLLWDKINDEHLLLSMREECEMGRVLTSYTVLRIKKCYH